MKKIAGFIKIIKNPHFLLLSVTIISVFSYVFLSKIVLDTGYKFNTLESIFKYANYYPENYRMEDNDWNNPNFINLYRNTLKKSTITKVLTKLRLKNTPILSAQEFNNLLEKVTLLRTNKRLASPFNLQLELKKDARCIVFGDLHSALHSFARDLEELKRQKIIDSNLKIIAPETYIIILGDVVNRGPYCLEILNIMLALMEKNLEKVIYVRGNHEPNSHWRNFVMMRQIQVLFPHISNQKQKNNLPGKIDKFFNTLPDSVVISVIEKENSHSQKTKTSKIICSWSEQTKLFENKTDVKFMLLGEKKFDTLKEVNGLDFLDYDQGIAKWALLSAQTTVYRKYFNFHNDAFVELLIGPSAEQSILNLNFRDARGTKEQKFKQVLYNPIFGHILKKRSEIIEETIFKIGSSMGFDGVVASISKETKDGLEAAIYSNNGGSENLIIPIILNDSYDPKEARTNIEKLVNIYHTNTIVAPMGSPTLGFYLDLVKSGKVYVFFPYTGAIAYRKKELKNIIHFRASYDDEARSTINYLVKEYGVKNFALFYQNDAFGAPIAEAARDELKKLGITKWLDLPHLKTQTNFDEIIRKIKLHGPDTIALFSTEFATGEFITQLKPEYFSERIIFGGSYLFSSSFRKLLESKGIEYVLSAAVPEPDTSDLKIAKMFVENITKQGKKTSANAFEFFIAGSLICDAINKIEPPIAPDKIIKYFENMKNYKFKGLTLTFNPEHRDLSQPVWVRNLEKKWVKYEIKKS